MSQHHRLDTSGFLPEEWSGVRWIGSGVGAIVLDDAGRVLLTGRSGSSRNRSGFLDFPGGGQLPGETLEEAIKREVVEETGISIEVISIAPLVIDDILVEEQQHWNSISFVGRMVPESGPPRVMEPDKFDLVGFYSPEEIEEFIQEGRLTDISVKIWELFKLGAIRVRSEVV